MPAVPESNDHEAALAQIREHAAAGRLDAAEASCHQLLTAAPSEPEAWAWRGLLAGARQQWNDAESLFRRALALRDNHAPYWSYLSDAVRRLGKAADAENLARRAIDIDPTQVSYWVHLARALADQRKHPGAADAYREALSRAPIDAAIWEALAGLEDDAGNTTVAKDAFERSIALAPLGTATVGYAYLLSRHGETARALELLNEFLSRHPQAAAVWMVLAHVHLRRGSLPEAENACLQALSLAPQLVGARCQLVEVLGQQYRVMEAEQQARKLVADAPEFADGWKYLGMTLGLQAACEESFAALRKALAIQPDPTTHSKLLCGLQYAANVNPESLLKAHKEWAAAYELPHIGSAPPPVNWPKAGRKLRLGFVSADFREHPIGFLALPALEHLDKTACSVICYSERAKQDAYTNRFRAAADIWRDTNGRSDLSFAELVRSDQIDVLFDLSGHFGYRLQAFARKLAPLQVTWLGYVGTTGLSAMNFLLADRHHVQPGEERWYTEAILRMPNGYACYAPPAAAPPVVSLPALDSGRVTFGCFNNPAKYTSRMFDVWAKILTRLPDAQLLLKCCWPNPDDLQTWFHGEFRRRGVNSQRILVEGSSSQLETMAGYGRVDLALDTQPYSGGATTCEALWMGVPVITYAGKTFAGRHSVSHLTNAGYSQFIANDEAGYVELAVRWANQLQSLASIRTEMREKVRRSSLCDAPTFAADFLNAITRAHQSMLTANERVVSQ